MLYFFKFFLKFLHSPQKIYNWKKKRMKQYTKLIRFIRRKPNNSEIINCKINFLFLFVIYCLPLMHIFIRLYSVQCNNRALTHQSAAYKIVFGLSFGDADWWLGDGSWHGWKIQFCVLCFVKFSSKTLLLLWLFRNIFQKILLFS